MKIVILNGSPKGELSITLQHAKYIQRSFSQPTFSIHHISSRIGEIEKRDKLFQDIVNDIKSADGVIFAVPVYYFLIPAQFKRFIEIIWESGVVEAFRGKYAVILTTSVHFYDYAAHEYMIGICDDLGMKYLDSFSAGMGDFLKKEKREKINTFAEIVFEAMKKKMFVARRNAPLAYSDFIYQSNMPSAKINAAKKKILIVTDFRAGQRNLDVMTNRLAASFSERPEIANINDIVIKGGCTGCINCGYDNRCIYDGADDYSDFYKNTLQRADIVIFAGCVKDRYLSSRWKLFFDRAFLFNHVPSLLGKQIGFIISGPLRQLMNLRQVLEGYVEVVGANLVGFVTDEDNDSGLIDSAIDTLAVRMAAYTQAGYIRPHTGLSIGARKVLRDEIWKNLRFVFQADDRYYRKHGMYDFPQKNIGARVFNDAIILITKVPMFRKMLMKDIKGKMVKPYMEVLKKVG